MNAPVITIMNAKGGSGKSTITTNLATYYAKKNFKVSIVDYDPQCSSIKWLNVRPKNFNPIYGISTSSSSNSHNPFVNKNWKLSIPHNTECILLDTPAGLDGFLLDDIISQSSVLLIPVLPSAYDIRATAEFLAKLKLNSTYRNYEPKTAVIANRVTKTSLAFIKLLKFLNQLSIPLISSFSDTRYYLQAAEKGMGINELATAKLNRDELNEWEQLTNWINIKKNPFSRQKTRSIKKLNNFPQFSDQSFSEIGSIKFFKDHKKSPFN